MVSEEYVLHVDLGSGNLLMHSGCFCPCSAESKSLKALPHRRLGNERVRCGIALRRSRITVRLIIIIEGILCLPVCQIVCLSLPRN